MEARCKIREDPPFSGNHFNQQTQKYAENNTSHISLVYLIEGDLHDFKEDTV